MLTTSESHPSLPRLYGCEGWRIEVYQEAPRCPSQWIPAEDKTMTGGLLHGCDKCGTAWQLLAKVGDQMLCGDCWNRMGRPFPRTPISAEQVEQAAREAMLARGGADRYRVRAGKS